MCVVLLGCAWFVVLVLLLWFGVVCDLFVWVVLVVVVHGVCVGALACCVGLVWLVWLGLDVGFGFWCWPWFELAFDVVGCVCDGIVCVVVPSVVCVSVLWCCVCVLFMVWCCCCV